MIPKLSQYKSIVGSKVIEEIKKAAEPLEGKHVVHINSTSMGGGVAEILNTLVFLMNDTGINTGWRVLLGSQSFFRITKGLHNALQGRKWEFNNTRKQIYFEFCKRNAMINHIKNHDIVVIHDPQPLGMIKDYNKRTRWIWRCHIDMSNPYRSAMESVKKLIAQYNAIVISSNRFKIKSVRKPQFIIPPSIDPLSRKNIKLTHNAAKRILSNQGIDIDRPIISQIGRFDPWKGHLGTLQIYRKIKEKEDCRLVLMGNMAADDPEGPLIFNRIKRYSEDTKDVTLITESNDILVNALQQESAFVVQNSIKEGFGLTVAEALWKKTPVIGRDVGGIPLQIINGKTGYIMKSLSDGVRKGIMLLKDKELRNKLGEEGHTHIKNNFLVTRHLKDYLNLFEKCYPASKI